MSETTQPTPQPTPQPIPLSPCLVAELVRSLDMTAEFLRLASPRVRTELSAYLADFHPHIEREELIDLLGNRAVDLFRLDHHHTHPDPCPHAHQHAHRDMKEISS